MALLDDVDDRPITGINVTPLVDVTLVLLIVFMMTAQLIVARAMPVDPPAAVHGAPLAAPLVVTLDEAGTLGVDGRAVTPEELARIAADARARDRDTRVVIRAADHATHGGVVRAMDVLKTAGITKIAFAVKPP